MPIDDLIPDALGRAAGALPRSAGEWDELRSRAVARRRRRRGQASVALATVVLLAAGVVLATGSSHDDHSVVATPPRPAEVVATINGQVVVLSADAGHVVRTLSESAPNLDATNVTVTPDGETVYVQRGTQCDGTEPPSIWKMSARGGPAFNIGPPGAVGINPLVSPDGRWLAYTGTTSDAPGVCGPFDRLIVESLAGGDQFHIDYTSTGLVNPLAWDATSSQLGVFVNVPDRAIAAITVDNNGIREVRRLALPNGNGYSFLPSNEAVTAFSTEKTSRIATFDLGTGAEGRTVTEVAMPLFLIDVNTAGNAFLLEGPLGDTINGHDLYRATTGEREPVKFAEHVKDAAWLPAPQRPEGEIVAQVVDGGVSKLVVISASTGEVVRTLLDPVDEAFRGAVDVPADGHEIYVGGANGCSSVHPGRAGRIGRDGGAVEEIVGAASSPEVSADGHWLTYEFCQSNELGITEVDSGLNYLPYGGSARVAVMPLAIAPDGSRLVFQGADGNGDGWPDAFVMHQLPFDSAPLPLTMPGPIESAAYLPDGRLVVAYIANSRHNVVTVDDSGAITERLFESVSEGMVHMSADASGRLLLVFDGGAVQVWTPGSTMPTPINVAGLGVRSATWLPSPTSETTTSTAVLTETPRPDSLFVVTFTGDLVEMDAEDGTIRRVIASNVDANLALSPDGAEVFTERWNRRCANQPEFGASEGIVRVDLANGDVQDVDLPSDVRADFGAIWSPDGQSYAYATIDCKKKGSLVVRDPSGAERRFTAGDGALAPFPRGWDADGRHLLVTVADPSAASAYRWWYVDTAESGSIEQHGVQVPALGNLTDLQPLGTTGRWIAIIGADHRDGMQPQIVEYDIARGVATRTLLTWTGLTAGQDAGIEATDASGRHLLLTTFIEGGSGADLYRWSEGDAQPTKIAEGIAAADW